MEDDNSMVHRHLLSQTKEGSCCNGYATGCCIKKSQAFNKKPGKSYLPYLKTNIYRLKLYFKNQLIIPVFNFDLSDKIVITFFTIMITINSIRVEAISNQSIFGFDDIEN